MKCLVVLCTGVVVMFLFAAPAALALEGDFNADGVVNAADRQYLVDALNTQAGDPGFNTAYDLDGDGMITLADLGTFLNLERNASAR